VHAGLGEVVSEFLVEGETGRLCRRELDRSQLYVDEKYVVQLGCSSRVQLDRASAQLGALLKSRAIRFASAADKGLRAIEEAWSVDHPDQTLKAQNHILLDEIARILGEHPGVALEVHGESARLDEAPDALARYYKRRPKEDAQLLSMHLARNRSEACVRALVARNKTLEKRLSVCRARTGKPQTEFVPSALLGLSGTGFQPTVVEFKVAANTELMTTRSQEVRVSVERQTGDVLIKLVGDASIDVAREAAVGLGKIVAGREMLALGGQDDHPHLVVMRRAVEGLVELVEQRGVLGVGPIGAVQADAGDARLGDVIEQGLEVGVGHAGLRWVR
jgi:hypothetical protein